ncbi:MAG TPA: CpXC domain-containing protein [Roseiflexaceae bacterium]|nr:CpXC domain-containing protein [Roseiflexaceae bacterium]
MPISYSEYINLTCPSCGARFETDAWTLVDAAERSDLAQALREGSLNLVTCPKCGAQVTAGAALLFHDPAGRRVYFAVPPNVEQHVWRERAQELLYQLVGSLPEDERRPYLGDVQVEQELDGVRRALLRHDRRRGLGRQGDKETRRQGDQEIKGEKETTINQKVSSSPPLLVSSSAHEPLIEAVRALLAADTDAEFNTIVAANPSLLDESADTIVRELADLAYADGERDVSTALRELRIVLARLRIGGRTEPAIDPAMRLGAGARQSPAASEHQNPELSTQNSELSDVAYQALVHAVSPDELRAATRDYPTLLETWADAELATRIEAALDEGNERLARTIETQREGLADLRAQLGAHEALLRAVQALLAAEGEDAVAGVLAAYPILLTDTAQEALSSTVASSLEHDDKQLAEKAASRQALLRTVRAGLEER